MHSADKHKIRIPKLRTRTTAWKVNNFGSSHNKAHYILVVVKRILTAILKTERQAKRTVAFQYTEKRNGVAGAWYCSPFLMPWSRTRLGDIPGSSAHSQTHRSQQDVAPWDTCDAFSKKQQSHFHCIPHSQPNFRNLRGQPSALLCSVCPTLRHHAHYDFIIPLWSEYSFGFFFLVGTVLSTMTLLVHSIRWLQMGNCTTGLIAVGTTLHVLCSCEIM